MYYLLKDDPNPHLRHVERVRSRAERDKLHAEGYIDIDWAFYLAQRRAQNEHGPKTYWLIVHKEVHYKVLQGARAKKLTPGKFIEWAVGQWCDEHMPTATLTEYPELPRRSWEEK